MLWIVRTPLALDHMAEVFTKMLADAMQAAASFAANMQAQLAELCSQPTALMADHAKVNEALRRYQLQPSLIDQAANWYAMQTWYDLALYDVSVLAVCALLGALLEAIAAWVLVAAILLAWTTYLLDQHFSLTTKKTATLLAEVTAIEQQLLADIRLVHESIGQIEQLCQQLNAQHQDTIECVQAIVAQNGNLQQQIGKFEALLKDVEEQSQQIRLQNQATTADRSQTNHLLQTAHAKLVALLAAWQERPVEHAAKASDAAVGHAPSTTTERLLQQQEKMTVSVKALLATLQRRREKLAGSTEEAPCQINLI